MEKNTVGTSPTHPKGQAPNKSLKSAHGPGLIQRTKTKPQLCEKQSPPHNNKQSSPEHHAPTSTHNHQNPTSTTPTTARNASQNPPPADSKRNTAAHTAANLTRCRNHIDRHQEVADSVLINDQRTPALGVHTLYGRNNTNM